MNISAQHIREKLTLVLIGLLPFHAFLVTVGTKLLRGPGQPPLAVLALWKEGLLGLILVLAILEIIQSTSSAAATSGRRDPVSATRRRGCGIFFPDGIDACIVGLLVIALTLFAFGKPDSLAIFALGFRYDFIFLIAFLVLRRVEWSDHFRFVAIRLMMIIGAMVSLYGLLSLLLPDQFFAVFGYSDFHSLYKHYTPLAPFQYIQNTMTRRMQSTMSGPNQLGLWLLIPLSVGVVEALRRRVFGFWVLVFGFSVALVLTFSRTVWIAAVVIVVAALWIHCPRRQFVRFATISGVVGAVAIILLAVAAPRIAVRISSTRGHLDLPIHALETMVAHPLGLGLGMAGPATNRRGDTCVFLRPQDDPRWANGQRDLCVFTGTRQVQPVSRTCDCPLLTENWYLQMGVELGWVGMGAFVVLILLLLRNLWAATSDKRQARNTGQSTAYRLPLTAFLAFLAISAGALFLHAWEDSATAYTVWILIAIATPRPGGDAAVS